MHSEWAKISKNAWKSKGWIETELKQAEEFQKLFKIRSGLKLSQNKSG